VATAGRAVDDADQRADRKLESRLETWLEFIPAPCHADFEPGVRLAASDQQCAAPEVEIGFGERERFVDAQTGPPTGSR
jgi:hypothetical protein